MRNWYLEIKKPSFSPPSWLFGPVWSILYILIAVSFWKEFNLYLSGQISFLIILPFILNLIFNFSFMPIQFRLRNNYLAAVDILLVLGTLIWTMSAILPIVPWVVYINIPYLLWVSFATILQLTITWMNK